MKEVLVLLGSGWGLGISVMIALWLTQLRTRNAGIVDLGWAGVTGGLAVWYAVLGDGSPERRLLVGVLGAVWGGRLAWHLWRDRIWGQPEEGRYVTLRKNWSPRADRAFFIFFQAQALAALALSLPFALASRGDDYRRYQQSTSPFVPWPPRPELPLDVKQSTELSTEEK